MTKKRRGSLLFPLLLVFVGLMFLLINLGVVDRSIWSEIIRYWPVLLILAGIDTLLRRSSASAALATVISVGVLVAVAMTLFHLFAPDSWMTRTHAFSYALDGSPSAEVILSCSHCVMDIRGVSESTTLISGQVTVRSDERLTQSVGHVGDVLQFNLKSEIWLPVLLSRDKEAQLWEARLNPSLPLVLSVETDGAIRLDLSELQITSADVSAGDGPCYISLGQADTSLYLSGDHLTVTVPRGVAARITGSASRELSVPTDYIRMPDGIQSPNYDVASHRIQIILRLGARRVEIQSAE